MSARTKDDENSIMTTEQENEGKKNDEREDENEDEDIEEVYSYNIRVHPPIYLDHVIPGRVTTKTLNLVVTARLPSMWYIDNRMTTV